jgi:hypothetical protein
MNRVIALLRKRIVYLFFLIMLVLMLCVTFLFNPTHHTHAASISWSLGSDTIDSQLNNMDIVPATFHQGSTLWVVYSDGRNVIHRFEGTTMDNLVEQANGGLDSSFNRPNGDDRYWLGGIWTDSTTWYATVHIEFHYQTPSFNHFRRIDLATSTDEGVTWHDQGDILTSANSYKQSDYPNGFIDFGDGDQKLFVDTATGYFYLYYLHSWINTANNFPYEAMRVARCPISAKMAPGCWKKWYDNGWSENGLGGHDSDVFTSEDSAYVFYDTYLQQYVAIGRDGDFISTATDLSTQNWTPRQSFASNRLQWYNWVVDPTSWDALTVGQSFRLYSASNDTAGQTKYMTVTFGSGSSATSSPTTWYPPVSVNDGNPGWQRHFANGTYTNTYTNDFSGGLAGWQAIVQKGNWSWKQSGDSLTESVTPSSTASSALWELDTNSPSVADGDLTFLVNTTTGSRFSAIFRYNSSTSWATVYYDNGVFGYQQPGSSTPLFNLTLAPGTWHTVEVGFVGSTITITVDTVQKYNGSLPSLPTAAGQVGFGTWYDSTTTFDSLVLAYNNPSNTTRYQASSGFTGTQKQNQWSYQYSTNGEQSFQSLTWDASHSAWVDANGYSDYCDVFISTQHPGNTTCDSARVWVAPGAGTVSLSANGLISVASTSSACDDNTSGVKLRILKNGSQIWPSSGWQSILNGQSYSFPGGVSISVATGDSIQFVDAHAGTINYCDTTTWDPIVLYTSQQFPSTTILMFQLKSPPQSLCKGTAEEIPVARNESLGHTRRKIF